MILGINFIFISSLYGSLDKKRRKFSFVVSFYGYDHIYSPKFFAIKTTSRIFTILSLFKSAIGFHLG